MSRPSKGASPTLDLALGAVTYRCPPHHRGASLQAPTALIGFPSGNPTGKTCAVPKGLPASQAGILRPGAFCDGMAARTFLTATFEAQEHGRRFGVSVAPAFFAHDRMIRSRRPWAAAKVEHTGSGLHTHFGRLVPSGGTPANVSPAAARLPPLPLRQCRSAAAHRSRQDQRLRTAPEASVRARRLFPKTLVPKTDAACATNSLRRPDALDEGRRFYRPMPCFFIFRCRVRMVMPKASAALPLRQRQASRAA